MPKGEYGGYVQEKIIYGIQKTEFRFIDGFSSSDGKYNCSVTGDIRLEEGISKEWGSIYFPGGSAMKNVIMLPPAILAESSYTIGMWLKPGIINSWTSVLYARYMGGFMSYVPYAIGGNSVFRISEDSDLNGWHDILTRQIPPNKWSFVCMAYNAGISRCYINGRKCGYKANIPLLPVCKQIIAGGDPFQSSYNGYLSALVFYGGALSDDEVQDLYQQFLHEDGFNGEEETFWNVTNPFGQ